MASFWPVSVPSWQVFANIVLLDFLHKHERQGSWSIRPRWNLRMLPSKVLPAAIGMAVGLVTVLAACGKTVVAAPLTAAAAAKAVARMVVEKCIVPFLSWMKMRNEAEDGREKDERSRKTETYILLILAKGSPARPHADTMHSSGRFEDHRVDIVC